MRDDDTKFDPCARRECLDALRSLTADALDLGSASEPAERSAIIERAQSTRQSGAGGWQTAEIHALRGSMFRAFGDYERPSTSWRRR